MRSVLARALVIAASTASVIIEGETGTGKELLARMLHGASHRLDGPFVAVNCAAIPSDLIESELFGHARGAFSGAVTDRRGLFEEATGGTLLLDEIAETPLSLQAKLLRALQEGEVRRVGANRPTPVDVRVLAATHQDLAGAIRAGTFREDLYYRLKVFTLRLPPLRERDEDVLPIARDVLLRFPGNATGFEPEAERALTSYRWPGNVRELVNAVRHAAVLAHGSLISLQDLPEEIGATAAVPLADPGPDPGARGHAEERSGGRRAPGGGLAAVTASLEPLALVERRHILAVVDACGGNQAEAARVLGIARNTLWRKLESYHRSEDFDAAPHPDGC